MSYVISRNSNLKVYHKKDCRYVKQIKYYNKSKRKHEYTDFERMGYRPCKCCFTIAFKYESEIDNINYFVKDKDIKHKLIGKDLIIITEIGYWKINYLNESDSFVLYHGNLFPDDENPERYLTDEYHLQKDVGRSKTLMKFFMYIRGHDDFRKKQLINVDRYPRRTKKQRKLYERMKKKKNHYMIASTLRLISSKQISGLERENRTDRPLEVV